MEPMLILVAMMLSKDVHGHHCWDLDKLATGYVQYRQATNLREIDKDKVVVFNQKDPQTDWEQVWLMDMPDHSGVIMAGYEDMVCSIGLVSPRNFVKTIEELEGGKT